MTLIAALSRRGGRVGMGGAGVALLYRRGGCVGVLIMAALSLRGDGVGVTSYLRDGGVGVGRDGVLFVRCGRGTGVKIAVLSLRGDRGVVVGLAKVSLRSTGSR